MEKGPKNEDTERETLSIKEAQKDMKKTERANKKRQEGIPEGVPKIGEIYTTVDKDEKIEAEKQQEERIHIENQKKKKEKEDHMTIKTEAELSQEKALKKNRNIIIETQIEHSDK